jgi:hypothetical protein
MAKKEKTSIDKFLNSSVDMSKKSAKEGDEINKKRKKEADEMNMAYKLAYRKKGEGKEITNKNYDDALSTIKLQKNIDKMVKEDKNNLKDLDVISDKNLSDREGSFKKGGLVKQGKPKLAKKGWR